MSLLSWAVQHVALSVLRDPSAAFCTAYNYNGASALRQHRFCAARGYTSGLAGRECKAQPADVFWEPAQASVGSRALGLRCLAACTHLRVQAAGVSSIHVRRLGWHVSEHLCFDAVALLAANPAYGQLLRKHTNGLLGH